MNLPIARDGVGPFFISIFLSGIFYFFSSGLSFFLFFLAIFIAYFFRKPSLHTKIEKGEFISPAWGRITRIEVWTNPSTQCVYKRISIFLSIFDVHCQVAPCEGIVESIHHQKGQYLNAMKENSSESNEQNKVRLQSPHGIIEVTQIAGLIARRIVCWVKKGQSLNAGDYFGLIKFGSRVDICLPKETEILVKIGEKVQGGQTLLGKTPPLSEGV